MTTIGTSDSAIPENAKWKINSNSNGYYFVSMASSQGHAVTSPTSSGDDLTVNSYSASAKQSWTINPITASYHGVTLKRTTNNLAVRENFIFSAVLYSTNLSNYANSQVTWSVTNGTGNATINSSTGELTGVSSGTVNVAATYRFSYSTIKSDSCLVNIRLVANGEYFIASRESGDKYIQVDNDDAPNYTNDGGIIEQWTFDDGTYQKWRITHIENDYYSIVSSISGYAITVPTGEETTENVDLILRPYAGSNNQKWKITLTSSGSYKIKAKSSESYTAKDLAMDLENNIFTNGLNVRQKEYVDNTNYGDEWILARIMFDAPNVILEGQEKSEWCWATASRMFAQNYSDNVIYTQSQAVEHIKGKVENKPGSILEIADAVNFYVSNNSNLDLELNILLNQVLTSNVLQLFMNNSHVVLVTQLNPVSEKGHVVLICGYVDIQGEIRYIVKDPWPVGSGEAYFRTYDELISYQDTDNNSTMIWQSTITREVTFLS